MSHEPGSKIVIDPHTAVRCLDVEDSSFYSRWTVAPLGGQIGKHSNDGAHKNIEVNSERFPHECFHCSTIA